MKLLSVFFIFGFLILASCKKTNDPPPKVVSPLNYVSSSVDGTGHSSLNYNDVSVDPVVKITFNSSINPSGITASVLFNHENGTAVSFNASVENNFVLVIKPINAIASYASYKIIVSNLKSAEGVLLKNSVTLNLKTGLNLSNKFPQISDEELLTLVQKQTFRYFWDFGHPVSGLSRERNTSGDLVTIGGSGFGVMSLSLSLKRFMKTGGLKMAPSVMEIRIWEFSFL